MPRINYELPEKEIILCWNEEHDGKKRKSGAGYTKGRRFRFI